MSFTIVLRRIYLIGIIFLAHLLLGSVSKILPRISYQRILSEWKDIVNDNLTLEFPFTNLPSEVRFMSYISIIIIFTKWSVTCV